jgi:molecular chaperone DnaK (HSP70)
MLLPTTYKNKMTKEQKIQEIKNMITDAQTALTDPGLSSRNKEEIKKHIRSAELQLAKIEEANR